MNLTFANADFHQFDAGDPFDSDVTSNLTPAGVTSPTHTTISSEGTNSGRQSPQGGISYIDQAVGGESSQRKDLRFWVTFGIRPASVRQARFTGAFIDRRPANTTTNSGNVGLTKRQAVARAQAAASTNLSDSGAVLASFSNPALARLLGR